ncbi:salicylate synthase [Tsukamurella sp. 8F]|uniref:salicylate synthase n=1 Tax=unclassified Tsukamurella TaxID=2633480 RepID=UPI0023BA1068|nr:MULTISPECIES: salicylate synthase [unclassified Tsukamurella]MDF0529317.1 salicylate synthase [Tsukamurella sp. 8J]MDF0587176.1 salicylate synthase [Tsukamurella sp. 8F]
MTLDQTSALRPVAVGPLDAARICAAWAQSGLADDYVAYERPSGFVFAGGVRARIILSATEITMDIAGDRTRTQYGGTPAQALQTALGTIEGTWTAYGWVGFEFTSHLRREDRSDGVLGELVVPEFEAVIAPDGTITATGIEPEILLTHARGALAAPVRDTIALDVGDDPDDYRGRVAKAVAEITRGDYLKVILSRRVPVPFPVDLPASYAAGRRANTPARSFLFRLSGFEAAGFSPEIVGQVDAQRSVTTEPLAGTRALHMDGADARALREELQSDPKEIVEHAVSVRLSCEEVRAVAKPGTTVVTEFMAVRERGSVQHLASTVRGELLDGVGAWRALDVLFPAVTASGIPKEPAVRAITRLEPVARGLYSGAVVVAGSDGTLDAALVLRAAYAHDGKAWLQAGAGIVGQSDPDREFEETREKLSSVAPHLVRKEADS